MVSAADLFTTREWATISWFFIIILFVCINKSIRPSFVELVKGILHPKIALPIAGFWIWNGLIIYLLGQLSIVDFSCTSVIVFWLFGSGLLVLKDGAGAKRRSFFARMVTSLVSWNLFIQYISDTYTVGFWFELMIQPVVFFVYLALYTLPKKSGSDVAVRILKKVVSFLSIVYIFYVLYSIGSNYKVLVDEANLKNQLMSILLLAASMPYMYLVALFVQYEILFLLIDHHCNKLNKAMIKRNVIFSCFLNLDKVSNALDQIGRASVYVQRGEDAFLRILLKSR